MRLAGGAALFVAAQLPIQLRVCGQRKLPRQQRFSHTEALAFQPGEPPDVAGGAAVRLCIARCIGGCIAGRLRARGPVAVARVPRNPKPGSSCPCRLLFRLGPGSATENVRSRLPVGVGDATTQPHHRSLLPPTTARAAGRRRGPCRPAPSGIGIRVSFADLRRGGPERDHPGLRPPGRAFDRTAFELCLTPTPVPHFQPGRIRRKPRVGHGGWCPRARAPHREAFSKLRRHPRTRR